MLNFCGIVEAILKMETGRNFSMSGINSGHHNLPTYEISLKSNNVEFVPNIDQMYKEMKKIVEVGHKHGIVNEFPDFAHLFFFWHKKC
jgi:hypothetical protein